MAWKRQPRAPLIRALLPFLVIYLYLPSAVAWEIPDVPDFLEKTLILAYTLVVAFRDFLNTADFRSMYEAAYYPSPTPSPAASPAPDFEHRLGLPHWDRYTTFSFGAGIAAVAFLPLLVRIACYAHARANTDENTDIDARTDADKPQPPAAAPGTSVPCEGEREDAAVIRLVHACADIDTDANEKYACTKVARTSMLMALRRKKSNIPEGRLRRAFFKVKWAIAKK